MIKCKSYEEYSLRFINDSTTYHKYKKHYYLFRIRDNYNMKRKYGHDKIGNYLLEIL